MEARESSKILVINIDISESIKGMITVHENDDPDQLSEEFLARYKLDASMKNPLVSVIESYQSRFKQRKASEHKKTLSQDSDVQGSNQSTAKRLLQYSHKYSGSYTKSSSVPRINYGHLLYQKGIKMKESIRTSSEQHAKDNENKITRELTFKPKISTNSSQIVKNLNKKKREDKSKGQIQQLKLKSEAEKMKECYFIPMIRDTNSKGIEKHVSKESSSKNIFDSLYDDAKERRKSQSTLIRKPSPVVIKDERKADDVVERLTSSRVKLDERVERMRKEIEANYDTVTGQKFFTPVTGRKPLSTRGEGPVWDELYRLKGNKEKQSSDNDLSFNVNFKKPLPSCEVSNKLFVQFRQRKFERIFNKLDSDKDGKISNKKINLGLCSGNLLKILNPLFDELQRCNVEMGIEEFVQKLDVIYASLSTQEKMSLVKSDVNPAVENFTFAPEINKNATKLAAGCEYLGNNLYERATAAKEIRELKLKKAKELSAKDYLSKTITEIIRN